MFSVSFAVYLKIVEIVKGAVGILHVLRFELSKFTIRQIFILSMKQ